jgi:hypothetical protein
MLFNNIMTGKKNSKKTSCKKGEIRRTAYTRKTSKGPIHVPAKCVPAKGKALSRGRKTSKKEKVLPKPKDDIHLSKFGYSTKKSDSVRHLALTKAVDKHGYTVIVRRLNLLRNYQAEPEAKKIMGRDIKFLQNKYKN